MKLSAFLKFQDDASKLSWRVWDRDGWKEVEFIDDYGISIPGKFFLAGHEFGPTHIIHACSEDSADEAWLDNQETIPESEVHEAYGAYDKLRKRMIEKGYADNYELRDFCNRWCRFYFQAATHNGNDTGKWEEWDLIEGYQYQGTFTGTGIVNVGVYSWIREIHPDCIDIEMGKGSE